MVDVFDKDGNELGFVTLSENQMAALTDGEIVVSFHTPQLMRPTLGDHSGRFTLRDDAGRIVCEEPEELKRYLDLAVRVIKLSNKEQDA